MIDYSFHKWIPFNNEYFELLVKVDNPLLSRIFIGNETSEFVQGIIDGINRVKNKEEEEFFYRNDAGFLADVDIHEEGVFIFDEFSEDPTKEQFIIPTDEFLELLESFKNFLVENGR